MECETPQINMSKDEMRLLFGGVKTIAVVGLSSDETKDSHRVAKYLKENGYKIIPVYPKEEMILGEKVYRSLSEVSDKVDLVDVFRKAEAVGEIVDQAVARKDVKAIWFQIGIINNEAAKKAAAAGLKVVQNKCAMVEHRKMMNDEG